VLLPWIGRLRCAGSTTGEIETELRDAIRAAERLKDARTSS
jgi:protein involved in polysaccharide export with SLBB domain